MNFTKNLLLKINNNYLKISSVVHFSNSGRLYQITKPILRKNPSKVEKIGLYGWALLIIPASTFALGVWQVKRKNWKENLIMKLNKKIDTNPIKLPENLDELKNLEYHPIHVRGTFLHENELYMGPRTLINKENPSKSSLISESNRQGYLVVTPFKLVDRNNEIILINRGWVPANKIKPHNRIEGQIEDVVDLVGLVRLNEPRPNFAMKNREGTNLYFYRDLKAMCEATGALPVFLDQTKDLNPKGGPIGGQTNVKLRNEHLSYIITWFSLSCGTSFMWYTKYFK